MKKIVAMASVSMLLLSLFSVANAANLNTSADYLGSLQENMTSGETHEVHFTPATAVSGGAGNNVVEVTFPDADDGSWCSSAGSMTLTTAGLRNSATALPGTLSASCTQGSGASSYDTITISGVNDLSIGTLYGVIISENAGELGTPANTSQGQITITTNNGTVDIDSSRIMVDILANDEVTVTGRVLPRLTFAISDPAVGFGDIDPANVRYATADAVGANSAPGAGEASQLTVSTNAQDGAVIEVRDLNGNATTGLYSSDSGTTLASAASSSVVAGTAGYGVYGKNASSLTIAEGFDHDSTADAAISTTYQTFASASAAVSSATVDVSLVSAVSNLTPAGDYADTLTFLATGRF